jgi:hypothetical protein
MSLTTPLAVFPGFAPGHSFQLPGNPSRYPTWNYKETPKWNNSRQQSINGRSSVVKYWSNPLWDREWTYGSLLYDDPSGLAYGLGLNPFYPQPVPATDKGILQGFFNGMQGGGNMFAYQPADSVLGGTMTVIAVSGVNAGTNGLFTIYGANTASLGQLASIAISSGATFLSGELLPILACSPNWIMVYFAHANYALTPATGTAFCGQILSSTVGLGDVDSNNNAEIVHTSGAYPTLLGGAPVGTPSQYTLVTESVQIIDTSTLTVQANGGSPPTFSIQAADTIAPYQGLVLNFSSTPTPPVYASFSYYEPTRFTEDTQDFEQFAALLWSCSSVKFQQDRL